MVSKYSLPCSFLLWTVIFLYSFNFAQSSILKHERIEQRRDNFDERGPFIGGDMVIPEKMFVQTKAGIVGNHYRWNNGTIPYVLDELFSTEELKVIMSAIYEIQNKTCIRFVKRTVEENYVEIVRGAANSGCWSHIGKQGGQQTVNLQFGNPGCISMGIIAHELIHTIGYFHEQARTDREDYVRVHWENIKDGFEDNFNMLDLNRINPHDVDYDFDSIMHYSAFAFSKNGKVTLDPLVPGVAQSAIGQRKGLSKKDGLKINNMYKNICHNEQREPEIIFF